MKFPESERFQRFLLLPASEGKAWAALLLAVAVLGLFGKFLFLDNTLASSPDGDLANQFYGWREFGFSELRKGHLALWNPYIYCGTPYFAGFQSALLYPLNWIFIFLPLVLSLNLSIALHVFLAGFFSYLWMSQNRLGFLPALFGAFVFMFGGAFFLHVYPGHLTNLCAMAWIPLVFLCVEKCLESPGPKNILLGSGVLSLQLLSGHPQYFLYTLLLAALYALALVIRDPAQSTRKISTGVGLLLAMALTAVQWLPALTAAKEFGRDPSLQNGDPNFFSLHPFDLIFILAPGFFGGPVPHPSYDNNRIWWETTPFIGAVAFLFVLNALRGPGLERNRIPLGLALLSILLALGHHTFLYPLLEQLPLFDSFRGSFKFCVFFQAFAALLAAKGLQAWAQEKNPFEFLSRWVFGLALLGMATLWAFAFFHLPSFELDSWRGEVEALKARIAPSLGDGRIFWSSHNDRSLSLGLPDVWGDDPMQPKRLSIFIAYRKEPPANPSADIQFLNLTQVKSALTRLAFFIDRKGNQFQITPSPFPRLPRVLLVGGWQKAAGLTEALDALSQPGFNPQTQVVLEKTPDPLPVENGGRGLVSLKNHSTDLVEFHVQLDKPQLLLMTDTYARGWKAEAYPDSVQKAYEVMPGDVFARAIPLSAGAHHFDLRYDPPGFTPGLWISLASLLAYFLAWGWVWKAR